MNPITEINERVDIITAFYGKLPEKTLCIPKKMKHKGREVTFTIFGMRHPTAKGKRMVHIFDMSDGVNDYRLEFDAENLTWTLINMIEGQYV